ncbi:Hypothetical Protein FCC1311_080502 [Hondaea fermentalgiana]|uniref:Uncharacterized protein n=1 Tax=Hondaea fermentalgiana TaxID=2315210 RepID=A0A2R5GMG6_9STRA|nr:Hypothetical Protein FCC1311_080502 [Hondaea fermentalgiana]|eukprot:GBG31825.1 Hypothetical Protein FCC1311_080502 [Hondaea fermentalgiana]
MAWHGMAGIALVKGASWQSRKEGTKGLHAKLARMGFSEFKRLGRRLSSQVFGADEDDFDADADYYYRGRGDGGGGGDDEGGTEQGPRGSDLQAMDPETVKRKRAARVRRRWREAIRKVVALNRFIKTVGPARRHESWARAKARQLVSAVLCAVITSPLDVMLSRALVSKQPVFLSPWTELIVAQAAPLSATYALLEQLVPRASTNASAAVKKPRYFGGSLGHAVSATARHGLHLLLMYPLQVAFTRLAVNGQPVRATLTSLSPQLYNGLSACLAIEAIKGILSLVLDNVLARSPPGTLLSIALPLASLLPAVPSFVMSVRIWSSNPGSLFPAQVSLPSEVAAIYAQKGLSGFFAGWRVFLLACPFELGGEYLSNKLVRHVIGPSPHERFAAQVSQVRETLELKQHTPLKLEDPSHLEAMILMASRHNRMLFVLMINVTEDSKLAVHDCATFAQHVDATFVIADARSFESLSRIAFSSRFPCFIPVMDGVLATQHIIPYRYGYSRQIERRLRAIAVQMTQEAMHRSTPLPAAQQLDEDAFMDDPHAGSSEML